MRLTAAALLLVALTACGGDRHYPANLQTNFLNSCESQGASTTKCECLLGWFERHVSETKFKADEDEVIAGSVPDDMRRGVAACT